MTGRGITGNLNDRYLGRLVAFAPITISRTASNTVDAAIAYVEGGVNGLGKATPEGGYGTPKSTPATAALGMVAQNYGRTTGYTKGSVTGINATVIISYDTGQARFVGQIVVTGENKKAFSAGGDSGSLIVNGSNEPIALLFAGGSTTTIGNPIALVLQAFQNAVGTLTIDGN
jgi:hypothetical protein